MMHWDQLTLEEQTEIKRRLAFPFEPAIIEWLPLASYEGDNGWVAKGGAYADVRAYQNRLDEVCGRNWSVRYKPLPTPAAGNIGIIAAVTIYGRTVEDVGESEAKDPNAWTSAMAQAFKRACSAHGIGRYLYDQDAPWVPFDKGKKQITREGIGTLNKHYFAWYTRVTGQNKPAQQQPASSSNKLPHRPRRLPRHQARHRARRRRPPRPPRPPHPDALITDSTKLAIYAAAKGIFGETEWTDALTWYLDAFSRTNMARSKTSNPDQLFEAEAQSLLAALERNSAALPEFWASAKASAVAKAAATADRKRWRPARRPSRRRLEQPDPAHTKPRGPTKRIHHGYQAANQPNTNRAAGEVCRNRRSPPPAHAGRRLDTHRARRSRALHSQAARQSAPRPPGTHARAPQRRQGIHPLPVHHPRGVRQRRAITSSNSSRCRHPWTPSPKGASWRLCRSYASIDEALALFVRSIKDASARKPGPLRAVWQMLGGDKPTYISFRRTTVTSCPPFASSAAPPTACT